MLVFILCIVDILFSIFIAAVADEKGRNPFWWFLISLVIDPVLALIILLLLPNED